MNLHKFLTFSVENDIEIHWRPPYHFIPVYTIKTKPGRYSMQKTIVTALLFLFSFQCIAQEQLEPQPLTQEEIEAGQDVGISPDELMQIKEPMTKEARDQVSKDMEEVAKDLNKLSQKTDIALGMMIKRSAWVLTRKGYAEEANQLVSEYELFYANAVYYYYNDIVPVELGDHKPISEKLATWYNMIETKLRCNTAPINLCKVFHLIDIKILNFGLPVTFKPNKSNQWCVETSAISCQDEYKLHFAGKPVSGFKFEYFGVVPVVSYWLTWSVCVGATFGAGAIGLICSPIGYVVEVGVGKYVAPKLSDYVFLKANP